MGYEAKRKALIKDLQESGAIKSEKVAEAFLAIPRENFVPDSLKEESYDDNPLPIGEGQTISQPTTVAIMTEALDIQEDDKILEIGTGSGYQAAILAAIANKGDIITVERIPFIFEFGKKNLRNFPNVDTYDGDGTNGYPYNAPYQKIIVTAEAKRIPARIFAQLDELGILVIPVNGKLLKVRKVNGEQEIQDLGKFVFVPLIGDH